MRKIIGLLFVLLIKNSIAQIPVDGFWWNPNESGRGITLEVQNGVVVAAMYAYDEMNLGRWYLGSGTLNQGVLVGQWDAFDGGQCSGCQYTSPQTNAEVSEGEFTITFETSRQATMQWSGGTMSLSRFMFAYPDENSYLYGIWGFTQFISASLAPTQFLVMNDILISDGDEFITGQYIDLSSRPVVASFVDVADNGENTYTLLIDSSTSFFRLYNFQLTKNTMTGLGWLYRKDENPVGSGSFSLGAKYAQLAPASSALNDINSNEKMMFSDERDEIEYSIQKTKGQFDSTQLDRVKQMESLLKGMNVSK